MDGTTLDAAISRMDKNLQKIIMTIAHVSADLRYDFPSKRGAAGTQNVYGETQQELDVWADGILTNELLKTGAVRAIVSEEREQPTMGRGTYVVTMDPLDGSSNIKSNNIFGTIIGIHKEKEILTKGKNQIVAFYVVYGPLTSIVMATERGINEYDYEDKKKKFFMTKENITLPEKGEIYSAGGGNEGWDSKFSQFISGLVARKIKLRYGGAFVGDINQVLNYGGIFCYPPTQKKPQGKLRLVIECNPMAFIMTKAGGAASDGKQPILEIQPKEITHRTPIYIGSKDFVAELEKSLA